MQGVKHHETVADRGAALQLPGFHQDPGGCAGYAAETAGGGIPGGSALKLARPDAGGGVETAAGRGRDRRSDQP
ncbi:hypothetical protein SDC9_175861 [bioreactor metagenome]|uniref:Uncharacterized protein n=1 Tax=bioreactor metagenome TaxID=1076179 RepID=A0A645GQB5_9ZZZZ